MRISWRTSAWVLLVAWPQVGCLQLPNLSPTQAKAPPAATRPLEQALKANPQPTPLSPVEVAQSLTAQADALEKSGRLPEAIVAWQQLRQSSGEHAVYATQRLARLYDRAGDLDRAEQECKLLEKNNKKDPDVLAQLGHINYRQGRWAAAHKYFQDAVDNRALDPQAKLGVGLALAQMGDYPDSLKELKAVVSEPEAYCNIAFVLNTQGKRDDAARAYHTALSLDPTMVRAQTELTKMGVGPGTPLKTIAFQRPAPSDKRGTAELEERSTVVAQADEGQHRLMPLNATLPAMPDVDLSGSEWGSTAKTKNKK